MFLWQIETTSQDKTKTTINVDNLKLLLQKYNLQDYSAAFRKIADKLGTENLEGLETKIGTKCFQLLQDMHLRISSPHVKEVLGKIVLLLAERDPQFFEQDIIALHKLFEIKYTYIRDYPLYSLDEVDRLLTSTFEALLNQLEAVPKFSVFIVHPLRDAEQGKDLFPAMTGYYERYWTNLEKPGVISTFLWLKDADAVFSNWTSEELKLYAHDPYFLYKIVETAKDKNLTRTEQLSATFNDTKEESLGFFDVTYLIAREIHGEGMKLDANAIAEIERIAKTLRALGLDDNLTRYPVKLLAETYKTISGISQLTDGKPLSLVIYPKSDWNRAFETDQNELGSLVENGHHVIICEANTDEELVERLGNYGLLKIDRGTVCKLEEEPKYDNIILGGHGDVFSLHLSDRKLSYIEKLFGENFSNVKLDSPIEKKFESSYDFDISDFQKYGGKEGLEKYGKDDLTIILVSCSTGMGGWDWKSKIGRTHDNLALMVGELFGAGRVFAPVVDASFGGFKFGSNGEIKDVLYNWIYDDPMNWSAGALFEKHEDKWKKNLTSRRER